MRRRSTRIAGVLATALACAAAGAPAALAAPQEPAPEAQAAALLDDTLAGLTVQQQQLQELLAALRGGLAPTGAALTPVRDLLYEVAGTQGLPVATQTLIRQIADLLGAAPAGEPLDPNLLSSVSTLLRDVAATGGMPPATAGLLTDLADVLSDDGVTGLTGQVLSLPPQLVDDLDALLTALQDGDSPTGTLLAPVADLLEDVAGTPGLTAPTPTLLRQLANAIDGSGGEVDPLLAGQASRALRTIGATPGLTPRERIVIERIATILAQQSPSGARAATRRDRAVIKRIRVNRARTRIVVRIACPRSAPATCATRVTARLGERKAARAKRARIAAGRTKVVRLRMLRRARVASMSDGGRLRVRVVTRFDTRRFAHVKVKTLKPRRG
jgi:hypothetical protein